MATLFISDLHLSAARPKTSDLFLKFLAMTAKNADALYILGDFFEAWIGADIMDKHDTKILEALKQFSEETPVFFMPGNRDFLMTKALVKRFRITYLQDPTTIQLYGQSVLLMHGDSLCTLDKNYQRYRRFVQHPIIQKVFLCLPAFLRRLIKEGLRKKPFTRETSISNASNTSIDTAKNSKFLKYWDVEQESVEQALRKYQAQILIHGHTHKPGIHDFTLNELPAKRVVLGDWGNTGNVLVFTQKAMRLEPLC